MNNELISVVIPVYNVESYLEKCLDSVINQHYRNIEIILVNDGSLDSSGKICNEYAKRDSRITVFHKENGGLSDARNYGTLRASGKYITFIDSDDYVDKNYVSYLHYLIEKYSADMSICSHRIIKNGKIKNTVKIFEEHVFESKEAIEKMLYHEYIDTSAWGKMYQIEVAKKTLFPKGKNFEDIGTTYKFFIESTRIAYGSKSLYNYIIRDNSIVTSSFDMKKLDLIEMTDDMAKNVLLKYPDLKNAVLRRRLYARFSVLNQISGDEQKDIKREIISFILKNGNLYKTDKRIPKRDKLAFLILKYCGYYFYKCVWNVYKRI